MGLNSTRTKTFNYVRIQIKSLMIGTLVARVFVQNHLRDKVYIPGIVNRTFENRTQSNSIHRLSSIEFD